MGPSPLMVVYSCYMDYRMTWWRCCRVAIIPIALTHHLRSRAVGWVGGRAQHPGPCALSSRDGPSCPNLSRCGGGWGRVGGGSTSGGMGSALLRDPERAADIIGTLRRNLNGLPVRPLIYHNPR